ncbi:MAG: 3-oxoacyl-[acyl-carrier-protein] reductase [Ignavibacteria bacterium]
MKLQNKVALVTGGSRGIGAAIVKALAKEGAKVVFTYHSNPDKAQMVLNEIKNSGGDGRIIKADASSFGDAQNTINFVLNEFGMLHILVNNAGITKDNLLLRMSEQDWDEVINTNLKSVFNYTKVAIKPMMNQREGKIINISSVVGIMGNVGQANYVAAKAGVIGLTKSLAREFASRNINVNAVAPGYIETDMTAKLNETQRQAILNLIPLKRIGKPEDIARVVVFLASEDANYITGQVFCVDGGMVM